MLIKNVSKSWTIAIAWIATSIAVIVGLFITKNWMCLFAFILPTALGLVESASDEIVSVNLKKEDDD